MTPVPPPDPAGPRPFGGALAGARILLTGHTGFKGSWLTLWLDHLGAEVRGIALAPDNRDALYTVAGVEAHCDSRLADINDPQALDAAAQGFRPDIVIHMAAQAIVRDGYSDPAGTFATNVVGTANVLDLARRQPSVTGVVVVSSDKCYENNEWDWGYRETDPLGGSDPYSASKACTELVAQAYRRSFFHDPAGPQLASARAGNVIGGGDQAPHRLIPDIVRATRSGQRTVIRNPGSVRPWQHVLEPLAGYLTLSARLLDGCRPSAAGPWNFGPDTDATVSVGDLCRRLARHWGEDAPCFEFGQEGPAPHEAGLLRLDSTKARLRLGWHPRLALDEALALTADWYRAHADGRDMHAVTLAQIAAYQARLTSLSLDTIPHGLAAE